MGCGASAPTRQAPEADVRATTTPAAPSAGASAKPKVVGFAPLPPTVMLETDPNDPFSRRRNTTTLRRIAISAEALADDCVREMKVVPKPADVHADLSGAMSASPLFESLHPELLASIVDSMEAHVVIAGDVVLKQGDPGDNLYVVHSGVYEAHVTDAVGAGSTKVGDIGKGQLFGELALLYNSPRAATICAREGGICYMLNRSVFQHLVKGYSTKSKVGLRQYLSTLHVLEGLLPEQYTELASVASIQLFQDGEYVCEMGSDADELFVILSGEKKTNTTPASP